MARSPKLVIFLTIFIDLLGFGIVIPILGPTNAEFVNQLVIRRASAAAQSEYPGSQVVFDNPNKVIRLEAASASQLASVESSLEAKLATHRIGKENVQKGSVERYAGGKTNQTVKLVGDYETNWVGIGTALLMGSFSLLQMLFSPFWGRLSDRYGRRPVLLVSLFGSTFSYFLFAISRSYELLLFSRILAGVSAANITAAQAYIADITSKEERTAGMGLIGMAFGLGFSLGPIFGWLGTWGWAHTHAVVLPSQYHVGPAILAVVLCGANFIWAIFQLPESLPAELRGKTHYQRFASTREALAVFKNPVVGPLIGLFFLVTFAFSNVEVSFSLYAKSELNMNLNHIYSLFFFIGLVMAFTQGFLVKRVVKRIPEQTLMIYGAAVLVVGLILLPVWKTTGLMLSSLAVLSIGQGMCQPCVLSLISRRTSVASQGNVFGTSQAASSLARIVGPAFGGIFYEIGHRAPFWAAAAIMSGAVAWAMEVRARMARHEGEPAEAAPTPAADD